MRYPQQFLDELKARLRPSAVIGKVVKLRRQGREFAGLSPFVTEKTPSFFVNDDKGFYHCFSSGKHGDIINFLQETDRLTFTEAVERLASEAGLPLPERSPQHAAHERARSSLTDLLEQAAAWFQTQLQRPAGEGARAYLDKRQIPAPDLATFRVGYAPADRTALKDYLIAKGAAQADLLTAGLLVEPAAGGRPIDRFNDRIIFPILDGRGRVVSFAGRALSPTARAKYLNGPDSPVFSKGKVLYGAHQARAMQAASDSPLVVVEGYFDVIACHRAGIPAAAPMGTALTIDQIAVAWRLHPEPVLCFDGDAAGRRAASRAIDVTLPLIGPGQSFRFAHLQGKDADEIYRTEGAPALRRQISLASPFAETLFVRERDRQPLDTPEARASLAQRLRGLAKGINDPDLALAYAEDLKSRLDGLLGRANSKAGRGEGPLATATPLNALRNAAHQRINPFHAAVAVAALTNPAWAAPYDEAIARLGFVNDRLSPLADVLVAAMPDNPNPEALTARIDAAGLRPLVTAATASAQMVRVQFLDPREAAATRKAVWSSAYETLIELGDAQAALQALRQVAVTASSLAAGKEIRQRVQLLERRISALDFAARDNAVG
ncbi:MAG: DNA primase [Caulobacterales bacterium 32-69-10]|nr:MAG: DNA primase [Caulobacterales bacterium 32-69-10]